MFDDPSKFTFAKVNFDHRFAYENLWQVRADYTIPVAIGDDSTIKVGAKYLDRKKSDDEESLAYKSVKGVKWTLDNVAFTGDTGFYDGMFHFGQRVDYDAAADYAKTASPAVMALDESGSIADSLAADYRVREKIIAAYAMATVKFGGLTLIPGIRMEHTKDETAAKVIDDDSQFGDGYNSFGSKSYTNWFPGLTARYDVNERLVLRGAVTTAIGRPAYTQLAPYVLVDSGEDPVSIETGNPDLKPLKAVNLDAAAEYYLPGQGLISVGLFYKHIDNPIYSQSERVTGGTFGGQLYAEADVSRPINVDSEIVKGIEINAQTRFTFLPAPFDGFGVSANYTHVSGHAKGVEDRPGDIPLFFQSKNIGTAQLFYEKYGAAVRVAYSYRSKYLDTLGGSADEDQYTDNNGQLDVHASYQITPQITVFGDASNLTDAPWRRFIGTKSQLVERERYDYSLRGGVQVHF